MNKTGYYKTKRGTEYFYVLYEDGFVEAYKDMIVPKGQYAGYKRKQISVRTTNELKTYLKAKYPEIKLR